MLTEKIILKVVILITNLVTDDGLLFSAIGKPHNFKRYDTMCLFCRLNNNNLRQ